MDRKNYATISAHVPKEVAAAIDARARATRRSKSFVVTEIICDSLKAAGIRREEPLRLAASRRKEVTQ